MQDIGGCRAVVISGDQVAQLVASYKNSAFAHLFRGEKDYITNPKDDGYRSHHLIYEYKGLPAQNKAYDKLRIEIQIRTSQQHAWATAVEAVGIFTRQALKANIGSEDWLRLFALMGSEIALNEGGNLIPGTPHNETERVAEICELCAKLRAVETLRAYRATIRHVASNSQIKHAKYYLVRYDYKENRVTVTNFAGRASQRANLQYTQAETSVKDGEQNIVLVSVDSIQQLRRAYPNYFLDTEQFTQLLTRSLAKRAVAA